MAFAGVGMQLGEQAGEWESECRYYYKGISGSYRNYYWDPLPHSPVGTTKSRPRQTLKSGGLLNSGHSLNEAVRGLPATCQRVAA